jgi:beta-phosphoglucomutase-like phosphatase (HAD superfamily)
MSTDEQVKQYENVFLFDLDGTLVDTDDVYFSIWNQILQEYDLSIDKPFFEKHIKGNSDQTFLKTMIPSINNMHIEEISNKKDTLFQNNIDEIEKYVELQKKSVSLSFGNREIELSNIENKYAQKFIRKFIYN